MATTTERLSIVSHLTPAQITAAAVDVAAVLLEDGHPVGQVDRFLARAEELAERRAS